MSKIIEAIPLPPAYYHASETSYWREDENSSWIRINETGVKNFVADHGYSKTPGQAGSNSEVDRCLMKIQSQHNVVYVGPLAGYAAEAKLTLLKCWRNAMIFYSIRESFSEPD